MPAPLAAAAMYFGLPRLLGMGADALAQQRIQSLMSQGQNPQSDTFLNLLAHVPRQSGIESTAQALGQLYDVNSGNMVARERAAESQGPDYMPAFHTIERQLADGNVQFYPPIDDYLTKGGQETSGAMETPSGWETPMYKGQPFYNALNSEQQSYGQTSLPAQEVAFGSPGPEWGSTGGMYRLLQEQNALYGDDEPGYANGGFLRRV